MMQLAMESTRGRCSSEGTALWEPAELFWKVQGHHFWLHLEVLIEAKNCISEVEGREREREREISTITRTITELE